MIYVFIIFLFFIKLIMFSLENKTALVTGSTGGIGLGILKVLARAGANVIMNGRQKPEDLSNLLASLSVHGNKAVFIQADVTSSQDRQRLFDESLKTFQKIDILVNNVGSFYDRGWESLSEKTFDDTMNLNVKSMFCMSKMAI